MSSTGRAHLSVPFIVPSVFPGAQAVAQVVYEEFYEQGDLEKKMGKAPAALMDRGKANELPRMQIGFMEFICIPLFEALAQLFPGLQPIVASARHNRTQWVALEDSYPEKADTASSSDSTRVSPAPSRERGSEASVQGGDKCDVQVSDNVGARFSPRTFATSRALPLSACLLPLSCSRRRTGLTSQLSQRKAPQHLP